MTSTNGNHELVVQADRLQKRYGAVVALRGMSLEIKKGEVFGLLGPNGAGKTTTIEILEGLCRADSGAVRVCGFDPAREATEWPDGRNPRPARGVYPERKYRDPSRSLS